MFGAGLCCVFVLLCCFWVCCLSHVDCTLCLGFYEVLMTGRLMHNKRLWWYTAQVLANAVQMWDDDVIFSTHILFMCLCSYCIIFNIMIGMCPAFVESWYAFYSESVEIIMYLFTDFYFCSHAVLWPVKYPINKVQRHTCGFCQFWCWSFWEPFF